MHADTDNITRRLKIARGQIDGILKMVEEDRYCIDISNQLMAVVSALKVINRDVLSAHLNHCVTTSLESQDEAQISEKMEEIKQVINTLSK